MYSCVCMCVCVFQLYMHIYKYTYASILSSPSVKSNLKKRS